ncbi:hypothetical protein ACFW04_002514 [Cataglyphis niger]
MFRHINFLQYQIWTEFNLKSDAVPSILIKDNQHNVPIRRPRIRKPRYIGDIKSWNLENPERLKQYLELTTKHTTNLKKQISALKKRCQRYKKKITNLEKLLFHLKENNLISDDIERIFSVCI